MWTCPTRSRGFTVARSSAEVLDRLRDHRVWCAQTSENLFSVMCSGSAACLRQRKFVVSWSGVRSLVRASSFFLSPENLVIVREHKSLDFAPQHRRDDTECGFLKRWLHGVRVRIKTRKYWILFVCGLTFTFVLDDRSDNLANLANFSTQKTDSTLFVRYFAFLSVS